MNELELFAIRSIGTGIGEPAERIMVRMHRNTDLFQVVLTLGSRGGFTHLLDCWQQQTNENRDNRN